MVNLSLLRGPQQVTTVPQGASVHGPSRVTVVKGPFRVLWHIWVRTRSPETTPEQPQEIWWRRIPALGTWRASDSLAPGVRMGRTVRYDVEGAIRTALETAGVEFIPENGGGAGMRLRKAG
jgi:hypothetical protein